jgi:ATP-dependent DNA helicase DinG
MGYKSIDATLPRLVERIEAILTKYAGKKGLIHTHSFRINSYLHNGLLNGPHGSRILTHASGPGSREDATRQHYESPDPTILMSPSMTEGLDLKGDLGRVNIICKVPFGMLNPYNRMRMERDNKWYQLQAAVALVQASGRCVRSDDDYALTVILDADFGRFLSQNQDILPKWWVDSIEFK